MFILMIRTAILYALVVLTIRLMGKRQIGELEPFELVIAIMISDLASLPMQDTRIPLFYGIIPIITLLILQTIITLIELKWQKAGEILTGKPSILISHGKIDIKELRSQRLTYTDLIEELRLSGYYNIADVQYAILETSGQLSIIPKIMVSPVVKEDLNITSPQEELPVTLILDGKINRKSLHSINKSEEWLFSQLKAHNIKSPKEVFIATKDSKGQFFYQLKNE